MSGRERSAKENIEAASLDGAVHSSSDENSTLHTNGGDTPPPPYLDPSTSSSSTDQVFSFSMDLDGLTPSQKAEKRKAEGNDKFKAGSYGVSSATETLAAEN